MRRSSPVSVPAIKNKGNPAVQSDSSATRRRNRPTRAEKSQQVRNALFSSAASVVGELGYSDAMIATITSRANVAQGTFYNYFESRQDLFDQLLPTIGREMLDFIRKFSSNAASEVDREELSFRGFFSFLQIRPEFYRILYEAEVFAPLAFRQHIEAVAAGYVRVLKRARARGELAEIDDQQLEALAYTFMGSRHYLCRRYARRDGEALALPEWVVSAYMNLVRGGLYPSNASGS